MHNSETRRDSQNGDEAITADALYEGTINETPHTMTDCNSAVGEVAVRMEGCDYDLSGTTTGGVAPVWITCPVGKVITIESTATGVKITIPAQTPTAGGVSYTNEASGKIKVTANMTGTTFTCHPTFICTLGGIPHHGNNTDYNGTIVMSAFEDFEGLPTPVTEGASVSVSTS